MDNSFHGRTLATLAATGRAKYRKGFEPDVPGFKQVPFNDIDALKAAITPDVCGIMLEMVQGEGGILPADTEYLKQVRELCDKNDILMLCDEVQCGIYRTGTPFAFQQLGVVPDIVSMAKGIAGGFPMGACVARSFVAEVFEPGIHGSTFGGSNLAVAAAQATLTALVDEGIPANVAEVGAYLAEQLATLPDVREVRGMGLMLAAEFSEDVDAPKLVLDALDAGLVLNYTGPHTLRFLPPLVCSAADVDTLMEKLPVLVAGAKA
jgi:acetylornithine aminotransferase